MWKIASCWSGIILFGSTFAGAQAVLPECSCRERLAPIEDNVPVVLWGAAFHDPLRGEVTGGSRSIGNAIDRSPLQVVIPERVLNRLLTEQTSDAGPVRDVIAQADVFGEQSMIGRVHVDCRRSAEQGEIHLVLQGVVNSDTVGWTRQAAVATVGRHDVVAIKPVMFDGHQVTTRRPQMWINVQNQNIGARTPYDGIPILNWIAQNTVRSEVLRRQRQVDAETAESVAARLSPKFNRDADRRLAKLNEMWRDDWMSAYRELWPKTLSVRTTDSELLLSASWPDAPALTDEDVAVAMQSVNADEITIRIHESVLNSALNRLPIAGRAFSEKQLREAVEGFIAQIGGRIAPSAAGNDHVPVELAPGMTPMIRMAKETPARFKIDNGAVRLIVKAGIEIAGQTVLAEDEITMPLALTDMQTAWQIDPGKLAFAKADQGAALVGMVETIVRGQLAASIPSTLYPKELLVTDPDLPLDSLRMTQMDAETGWLTISFAAEPRERRLPPESDLPSNSFPSESQPRLEVVPPRLQPIPDETVPSSFSNARWPSRRLTATRTATGPTSNPVPIRESRTTLSFGRSWGNRSRTPSDFLR